MVEVAGEKDDQKTIEKNDKIRWLYLILSLDDLAKSNGF